MKKILLGLLALYAAVLVCGLWQAAYSTSYYGTPIMADATWIFFDLNQFILSNFLGFKPSYFEIFLYQDHYKFWIFMAALTFFEFAVALAIGYMSICWLLKLRPPLRR